MVVIGIMDYLMKGDVAALRNGLTEAAKLMISLFERFEAGEPIAPSFVTMIAFRKLFDALASGDFALAVVLAQHLGGREAIEKQKDHSATINLGYTLKAFVEQNGSNVPCRSLEALRSENYGPNFVGYIMMFDAIVAKDAAMAQAATHEIIRGHKRESKGNGEFAMLEDQFISIWGIGMVNLARHYGLKVEVDDPFIPADLLV
jgi:hypothetical protein